ncbi:MAG: DUF4382 domain-containing protein [Ferruginibacter sp.]
MKTKKLIALIALILMAATLLLTSCQKDLPANNTPLPAGQQKVTIYMNDDPANYFKVLVDIRLVEVKTDTGRNHHDDFYYAGDDDNDDDNYGHDSYGQWDTLNIIPGIYDLLRLRNGADTLLAKGNSWNGRISKIRITLGSNSTLWTDNVNNFPLTICNSKPYVYVKVAANTIDTLAGGEVIMRIDFDVAKSIKNKGGDYCLKPEIKAYSEHTTGSIEGKVLPKEANAMVTVFNATDTAHAFPGNEGEYKIKGLKEGTYSVHFVATSPYLDSTISNIMISNGKETKLQNVMLRK